MSFTPSELVIRSAFVHELALVATVLALLWSEESCSHQRDPIVLPGRRSRECDTYPALKRWAIFMMSLPGQRCSRGFIRWPQLQTREEILARIACEKGSRMSMSRLNICSSPCPRFAWACHPSIEDCAGARSFSRERVLCLLTPNHCPLITILTER